MRSFAIRAMTLALLVGAMLCAGAIVPDDASAHVRDRDKVALCNGDQSERRHFHDGGIKFGYYYHIKYRYRSGNYVHYRVWKQAYLGTIYDEENKVVNCNNF